ncbi:DMT family transporter [uncultured Sulfitobacter sp.]|uniref:DMT family transporter n=1 Tax=uncultured Sulfitobacter sp. TaxID=191468 RepID=UPI0026033DA1|nr:DMT family transporter [uncultured Sulfitobacter sp.]
MRLLLLTTLTLLAFAANSVLARAAIGGGYIDPAAFTALRVVSGAAMLGLILALRARSLPLKGRARVVGAASLAVYMVGFSLAYRTLDAGLGALILFGVTQITMFLFAAIAGTAPNVRQVSGALVAFSGLTVLLWPGPASLTDPAGAVLMVAAGLGWGIYTIAGRMAEDPLAATAANFVLCTPVVALLLFASTTEWSVPGVALAGASGAVTSGLGYALWYAVLPHLRTTTAAVVQLVVPVLAIAGGAVILGEEVPMIVAVATVLVLGGIGLAVTAKR